MSKILVVDDDMYIRELVTTLLRNDGHATTEAIDGEDALNKLAKEKVDLCIVDVMMPKMNGFELCSWIRKYYTDLPLLMLTAKGDISQKVKGFDLGVDDYLTKPFENQELLVRVRALLRRYNLESLNVITVGKLTIDRNSFTVEYMREKTDIPMKEFELLYKLASYPGKTFTRNQLIEEIWGFDFEGNERTLDVHINRLRDRYPQEKFSFKITTIRGLGYRLEVVL